MKSKRIIHRGPKFEYPKDLPRHWLGGSAFRTHLLNSFTLIFPVGERFFIRSVSKALKQVRSEELLADAQAFVRQEAQHAIEHGRFLEILRSQGQDFQGVLSAFEGLIEKILEPLNGQALNLAVTAGLEHLTALLAEISLSENFLEGAPQGVRDLYDWHAAEEIEHRAVAFDVLQATYPSFMLRLVGIIYAYLILSMTSAAFTAYMLAHDGKLTDAKVWKDLLDAFIFKERLLFKAGKLFFDYLDPGFHPLKSDLDGLAQAILRSQEYMPRTA